MYVREKPAMALYVFACGHKRVEEDCSRRLGERQRSMVSLELGVRQHVNLVRYAAIALLLPRTPVGGPLIHIRL